MFIKFLVDSNISILCGFNIIDFDIKYFNERCERNNISFKINEKNYEIMDLMLFVCKCLENNIFL